MTEKMAKSAIFDAFWWFWSGEAWIVLVSWWFWWFLSGWVVVVSKLPDTAKIPTLSKSKIPETTNGQESGDFCPKKWWFLTKSGVFINLATDQWLRALIKTIIFHKTPNFVTLRKDEKVVQIEDYASIKSSKSPKSGENSKFHHLSDPLFATRLAKIVDFDHFWSESQEVS